VLPPLDVLLESRRVRAGQNQLRTPVTVGVVGLGRWGPEVARAFDALPQAELRWLCDHNPEAHLRLRLRYPGVRLTSDFEDLLNDEGLDGVALATPAVSHYELARRALDADKHVLVEKPLALRSDHADDLVQRSERHDRRLLVGNARLFDPGVRRLKKLIELGRLGDVYYLVAYHQGAVDHGSQESALWSLGPHDIALVLHLFGDEPVDVLARGGSYMQPGITDVVYCYLRFATGICAHLHLSLLDPRRARTVTVVGSRRTATFDDLEPERKLTIHDKDGDIVSPRLPRDEPLQLECAEFVATIRSPSNATASAREAAATVTVLERLQRSIGTDGVPYVPGDGQSTVVHLPLRASGARKRH
jgi:predicted dehydrogenase